MKNWVKQVAVILAVAIFGFGMAGSRAGAVSLTDGSEINGVQNSVVPNATFATNPFSPTTLLDIVISVTVNGLGSTAELQAANLGKVLWGIDSATMHFVAGAPGTGTGAISFTTSAPFTINFATPGVSKSVNFSWYVASSIPAVPLPAGGLLLLTGLGGLVAARRRKA